MSASRLAKRAPIAPHVCSGCERPLLQSEFALQEGDFWRVLLSCPSCGWSGTRVLDDQALDRLDRELDAGLEQLAEALEHFTNSNMREYHDCFAAALAADAILPEDF
jgi:hypothetical protein